MDAMRLCICSQIVMSGHCPLVEIIYRRAKCKTVAEWIDKCPQQAIELRQMSLTAATWTRKRLCRQYETWPFRIALLADVRATLEERLKVAGEVVGVRCLRCLDDFFTRRLRINFPLLTALDLATNHLYTTGIFNWAVTVLIHIGLLETKHARNHALVFQLQFQCFANGSNPLIACASVP